MKRKIYIAGKITGEPIVKCIEKFEFAERRMQFYHSYKKGSVIKPSETANPLKLKGIYFGIPHKEAMEICLEALKKCTHAYFLKDWKDSKGAIIEHQFCLENNIEIIYE